MKIGLFFKTIVFGLCAYFAWYYYNDIKESPFLVLSLGVLYILIYFLLSDCKKISIKSIRRNLRENKESGFDLFLNHPAKILVMYFFVLSFIGGVLLNLPFSQYEKVGVLDAFFTAVSASCVTGLTTLNIKENFSPFGQTVICILIELGGLGMMSIASIVLYRVGKISIKHERIVTSDLTDDFGELKKALVRIGKVTFITEIIGAILLSILFYINGENGDSSIFKGIFTSISAFCNAGFSLEMDSLSLFNKNPLILHITTLLIVIGSLSPATLVLFPQWLRGKKIAVQAKISIVTTLSLLFGGMFLLLFFEWNNIFAGLSDFDKINNAWFMSASLRTAGFNSVDIFKITNPSFIIVLILMLIGGTPGGTGGGIKTTTFAVLILTFFTTVTNRRNIVVSGREIRKQAVYKAITILIATLTLALLVYFMLLATQDINAKLLLFETISALGTTGTSLGVTSKLDEIGKVIIIFTMFIGRVGPLTLITILRGKNFGENSSYPPAKISLN